ncbi:PfkB family carbohydrate kinase, partial [Klebsiella pneumoniae]|uniref:PfkB family carbohydrate kinase n=1 Tax=Klebsiella pneumoniae TaxID=573 RepID=UPI002166BA2B
MENIEVICIGAAIVDIPLQPVSKNIFDVDSYPLERIAMTTGGDAINEATIISRLGHRTALIREGANKQVISSQADSLIKISRIWADFFPANTS